MKKHFLTICIFSALAFGSISCSSDDNHVHQENKLEKFKGTWVGTFSGGDTGNWTATIDAAGKATGTVSSNSVASVNFVLTGNVTENGTINVSYSYSGEEVGTMTGTLTNKTGSGTWTSPVQDLDGTWTGTKN